MDSTKPTTVDMEYTHATIDFDFYDCTVRELGPDRPTGLIERLKAGYITSVDATTEYLEEAIDAVLRHGDKIDWWTYSAHLRLTSDKEIRRYPILLRLDGA